MGIHSVAWCLMSKHLLTITLGGKLLQENAPPHRYLLVTLAVGEWHAMALRVGVPFPCVGSLQVSVVALRTARRRAGWVSGDFMKIRSGSRRSWTRPSGIWSHAREDAIVLSRTI